MVYSCYLCGRKRSAQRNLAFHKFPTKPSLNKLWREALALTDIDKVDTLMICSRHFTRHDYNTMKTSAQTRARLKANSIPSVHVPNPLAPILQPDTKDSQEHDYAINIPTSESSLFPMDIASEIVFDQDGVNLSCHSKVNETENGSQSTIFTKGVYVPCDACSNFQRKYVFLKRKYYKHLSELTSEDVPQHLKHVVYKAKMQISSQRRTIKGLQQQVRRLKNQIENAKELFIEMKNQNSQRVINSNVHFNSEIERKSED